MASLVRFGLCTARPTNAPLRPSSYTRPKEHAHQFTLAYVLEWLACLLTGRILFVVLFFTWAALDWTRITEHYNIRSSTIFLAAALACTTTALVATVYLEYAGIAFAVPSLALAWHLFAATHIAERQSKTK